MESLVSVSEPQLSGTAGPARCLACGELARICARQGCGCPHCREKRKNIARRELRNRHYGPTGAAKEAFKGRQNIRWVLGYCPACPSITLLWITLQRQSTMRYPDCSVCGGYIELDRSDAKIALFLSVFLSGYCESNRQSNLRLMTDIGTAYMQGITQRAVAVKKNLTPKSCMVEPGVITKERVVEGDFVYARHVFQGKVIMEVAFV